MTDSMLQVLFDNRSGTRPEIVVPVFNEIRRIRNLLDYYSDQFDLVFLDGGSTDGTLQVAQEANATAYRRCGPEWVGENHFVHYVNNVTASGYCFYMFADELADRNQLSALFEEMAGKRSMVIYGQRIDWFYGKKSNVALRPTPRGLARGHARYIADHLHESLGVEGKIDSSGLIDVHHFQVWRMDKYFGQAGAYAFAETSKHLESATPVRKFARRFLVSELLMLPRNLWRMRGGGMAFHAWRVIMSVVVSLIGLLCWIEIRYLQSAEAQLEFYEKKYRD